MKNIIALEYQEGINLMQWALYHPIAKNHLIHIPNEGKRSWKEGKKKKQEGIKSGVSDYFLAYPSNNKHGLWIELKRRSKQAKLTENQAIWLVRMEKSGYATKVAYGWEEAKKFILEYLYPLNDEDK